MYVTRDEILDAIDRMMRGYSYGLCGAFAGSEFNPVPFVLATGGKNTHLHMAQVGYFWPAELRNAQRLMFLAFMLTWHDELTGYKE